MQNNQWSELEPEAEINFEEIVKQEVIKPEVKQVEALTEVKISDVLLKTINRLELDIKLLKDLVSGMVTSEPSELVFTAKEVSADKDAAAAVEGVFDGEKMIGADGQIYPVPVNYASKSKLVEGDILKLTFGFKGNYIFKQISPIERLRLKGILGLDGEENYWVENNGRRWRILTASVTYFKAVPGDEASIIVPKESKSRWAAVENITRKAL